MKILLASFAPLRPEVGAGQMAIELAAALSLRGHEVHTWEPGPPPEGLPSRQHMAWRRRSLAESLRRAESYDVIDAPPLALSRALPRFSALVARTVQPDWLYWRADPAPAPRKRHG